MMRRIEINVNHLHSTTRFWAAFGRRHLSAALLLSALTVPVALAQSIETSWFEIELLAFSRDNNRPLLEQFPAKVTKVETRGSVDLLSPLYQPDLTAVMLAAPGCPMIAPTGSLSAEYSLATDLVTAPVFAADEASLAAFEFQQARTTLPIPEAYQPLPALCAMASHHNADALLNSEFPGAVQVSAQPPALLPLTPLGQEQHQPQPYLAPESALQLKDLAYQLKHRGGHHLLLHTAWRQPLSGKRLAKPYRWYAGSNFGQQFDYFGRAKSSLVDVNLSAENELLQQINALEQALVANPATALAELQPASRQQQNQPVWQLDGLIRVYSERMLFAETEFNLRRLSADGSKLSTYHSQDQSRLLIGEVHYLDHPHLGLVLQIRRFTPPLMPISDTTVPVATTGQ